MGFLCVWMRMFLGLYVVSGAVFFDSFSSVWFVPFNFFLFLYFLLILHTNHNSFSLLLLLPTTYTHPLLRKGKTTDLVFYFRLVFGCAFRSGHFWQAVTGNYCCHFCDLHLHFMWPGIRGLKPEMSGVKGVKDVISIKRYFSSTWKSPSWESGSTWEVHRQTSL